MIYGDLMQLLDYHYWARDRVLAAADNLTREQFTRDLGASFASVRDTLVHVYGAEHIWQQRWVGISLTGGVDPAGFVDVAQVRDAWTRLESAVRDVLTRLGPGGIEQVCEYRSLSGIPSHSTFTQMVQHVVNHGSYHRGQVAAMLRQLGAPPARGMDLIQFFREQG
jgi:uncharacterized damage-inducible protein DinB